MDDCKWNEEIRLLRPQLPNIATGFLNGGAEEGILPLHFYPGRLFRIVFRILKVLFPSAKKSKGGLNPSFVFSKNIETQWCLTKSTW